MKKLILCTGFLLLSFGSFSQEKNKTRKDTLPSIDELKIETVLLTTPRLSVEYERIFHQSPSYVFGFGLGFTFGKLGPVFGNGVHAFYRYYSPSEYYIKGMFIDGFLGIYQDHKHRIAPAVGFSVGKKWIHKKRLLLQIRFGPGITFNGEALGNMGIYLGYRFKSKRKVPKN